MREEKEERKKQARSQYHIINPRHALALAVAPCVCLSVTTPLAAASFTIKKWYERLQLSHFQFVEFHLGHDVRHGYKYINIIEIPFV